MWEGFEPLPLHRPHCPLPPQGEFSATPAVPLALQAPPIFSLFPPLPDPHHISGGHILHCPPPTEEAKEGSGRARIKFRPLSVSGVRQWPSLPWLGSAIVHWGLISSLLITPNASTQLLFSEIP